MGSKKKAQEQPVAAPATTSAIGLAPNGNAIITDLPKEESAQENAPTVGPNDELIERVKTALKTYPSLEAGYICAKGVYFDKPIAEKALAEGEELIIVTLEKK